MVAPLPQVVWNKGAFLSFERAYKKIKEESVQNAELVRNPIFEIVRNLPHHPEKYALDRFKLENPAISALSKAISTG